MKIFFFPAMWKMRRDFGVSELSYLAQIKARKVPKFVSINVFCPLPTNKHPQLRRFARGQRFAKASFRPPHVCWSPLCFIHRSLQSQFACCRSLVIHLPPQSAPNSGSASSLTRQVSVSVSTLLTFAALSLAEKHETRPSTQKMSSFTETIEVGSASSWNKVTLTNFGATFNPRDDIALNTVIIDPGFYDEDKDNEEFASRTSLLQ